MPLLNFFSRTMAVDSSEGSPLCGPASAGAPVRARASGGGAVARGRARGGAVACAAALVAAGLVAFAAFGRRGGPVAAALARRGSAGRRGRAATRGLDDDVTNPFNLTGTGPNATGGGNATESKFVFEAPYLAQIGIVRADSLIGAHLYTGS